MQTKCKRCYTYTRVSTSMQVDGYSLDAQQDRLNRYADFNKMEIVREYCDAGKSGKNITGRPEFQQMLRDVEQGRDSVDYILVFKLSRFGRNAADVLNSLQNIQDYGVNLICVEDGIDSSKESGKLTITVLSAVAEIERENILVQTMEGRRQKAREGKWNGGQAPLGYRLSPQKDSLVIEPAEAEIVRIIYDKYVHEGLGFKAISDYLNSRGYSREKLRKSDLTCFTPNIVKLVIGNPVYMGKIAYGRRKTEKIKGTRDQYHVVNTKDYQIYEGQHEPIIDEQLWQQAQTRRRENSARFVKTHSLEHEHILTGLLKCPVCGGPLTGTVKRRRNRKTGGYSDTFYYRCQHRRKLDEDHSCDFSQVYNQDKLNHEVEKVILRMVVQGRIRELVLQKLDNMMDVEVLNRERDQLQAQLVQAEGAKDKLTRMMDRLDISDPHYDRKYQDMLDRQDTLYDRIAALEDSIAQVNQKIRDAGERRLTIEQICRILEEFDKLYYRMTDMQKKEFMRSVIESIELRPKEADEGRTLKQIDFKFAVYYDGIEGQQMWLLDEKHVETCVLLRSHFRKSSARPSI